MSTPHEIIRRLTDPELRCIRLRHGLQPEGGPDDELLARVRAEARRVRAEGREVLRARLRQKKAPTPDTSAP